MECINKAVERNIPYTSTVDHKVIPGWKDEIKPFRDDAKFWWSMWVSAGRPENCNLHQVMKNTRNKYKHAIRRIKNCESDIRKDKFVQDCLSGNVNNILKEIKQMRNQHSSSEVIDGVSGSANIARHFEGIYSDLYTTHNDQAEVKQIFDNIDNKIYSTHIDDVNKISTQLISKIVKHMKLGKNDVNFDWRSNAIKTGCAVLAPHLSALLKSYFMHGHVSKLLLKCALVPIIKDQNSSHSKSTNYRAIAISSIIMKLIDYVIIELQPHAFSTSAHQFGFQAKSSTTLCSWAVNETVNYFTSRGSTIYACFLDLKKAFDLVKLSKLFNKMEGRMSPVYLRLLIHCYIKQSCCVRWNNSDSETFKVTNGVRQGSSTSPSLFSVYIDTLFLQLEDSGLGCSIDGQFVGVFGYADDIVMLSPSLEELQNMVDICKKFCDTHGIKISVDRDPKKSKTKTVAFNCKSKNLSSVILNNIPIPWSDNYKHLGHYIYSDEDMFHDLNAKCGEFNSKVHALRQEIGDQNPMVFMKLVNIYLANFYGSNLWDLSNIKSDKLCTS